MNCVRKFINASVSRKHEEKLKKTHKY